MVYCVVSTKGGVGKTTISRQIIPAILGNASIIEIDDNNNTTDVFTNSNLFKSQRSVRLHESEKALDEAIFSMMSNSNDLIIDAGGGNDTRAVIDIVKKSGLDTTYIVPVTNSLSQAKNAIQMAELLYGENIVYALNNVYDPHKIDKEFLFWYGSEDLGLSSLKDEVKAVKTIIVPHTPLFEIASTIHRQTIADMAQIAIQINPAEARQEIFKKANGNREAYVKMFGYYRQGLGAKEYIEKYVNSINLLDFTIDKKGKKYDGNKGTN